MPLRFANSQILRQPVKLEGRRTMPNAAMVSQGDGMFAGDRVCSARERLETSFELRYLGCAARAAGALA